MLIGEILGGLDLHDDFFVTQKIGGVGVAQRDSAIVDGEIPLGIKRNALVRQLDLEAVLVNGLHVAVALVVVHRHASANDPVDLVFEKQGLGHGCLSKREGCGGTE